VFSDHKMRNWILVTRPTSFSPRNG